MKTSKSSLLSSLLFGGHAPPPPVKTDEERAAWQRRSDAYGSVKPAILAALAVLGESTPLQIVAESKINLSSTNRALRRLLEDRLVILVRPASKGTDKAQAVWAININPPRSTDVPCPTCGAGVGEWCMTTRKEKRNQQHKVRIAAHHKTLEKLK